MGGDAFWLGRSGVALAMHHRHCASGCVVECRICNREVAGSNLSLGFFAPRSTQPSIPPGSVTEYQLRLGRQRQVWLIPIADEHVDVQVKLWNPLRTRAIPERFCGGDSLRRGAISNVCTFTFISGSPPMGSRPRRGRWAPTYAVLWRMIDFTFIASLCMYVCMVTATITTAAMIMI